MPANTIKPSFLRESDKFVMVTRMKPSSSKSKQTGSTATFESCKCCSPAGLAFLSFPNYNGGVALEHAFQDLTRGLGLNNTMTLFKGIIVPQGILTNMQNRDLNFSQKTGEISCWLIDYLILSAAWKEALWMLNNTFLVAGILEIMRPEYKDPANRVTE